MKTKVIMVGGFLGAGKTTLLWETARRLAKQGKKVGLITNDQAPELVDTAYLDTTGLSVSEVSGSCFCCNFAGFSDAVLYHKNENYADIIIAEPVGSCTDLSATIIQPIKQLYKEELDIAPLTVLADPEKLLYLLDDKLPALHLSAIYIIRKQFEEADIIVINKTDLLTAQALADLKARCEKKWPLATVLTLSAKTGDGFQTWINAVTQGAAAGSHLAAVDYDIYAEGEAVLGWLNMKLHLKGAEADWNEYARRLLVSLGRQFDFLEMAVGHVKLLLSSGGGSLIGNLTGPLHTLDVRGRADMKNEAELIINARVQTTPDLLKSIVMNELTTVCGSDIAFEVAAVMALSPGRPNPTYRFTHVVE